MSYSRHDEALVKPLAGLLGVAAEDAVFLDVEQLKPGDLWEDKLVSAVRESSVFVLCWCCQSEKSEFVAKEISIALEDTSKRLVPVLFCSTELPQQLDSRQWIDLRGKIVHACEHPPTPKLPFRDRIKLLKLFKVLRIFAWIIESTELDHAGDASILLQEEDADRVARNARLYFESLPMKGARRRIK